MMARPTATSAAATAMTKKTKICPAASWRYAENVTSNKFTAFSMSSTLMKMIIAFLLVSTPITPIENNTAQR